MEIQDKIADELGEKIGKKIGFGDFGEVFLLESGKVLKLTYDDDEVIIAKKLVKNKNLFKNILNYYNVGEIETNIKSEYKYFILMDYVKTLSQIEKSVINYAYKPILQFCTSFYQSVFHPEFIDSILDKFSIRKIKDNYLERQYTKSEIDQMKQIAIDFIPYVKEIAKDLKLHHINQCDFHGGNLGWNEDHTKMIIYDITKRYNPNHTPKVTNLKKYAVYEWVKVPTSVINIRIYQIADELGEEIEGYLGGQVYGYAFKTKSGKVLKITSDENEANIALKLSKNKRWFKYIVNFYNVGKVSIKTPSKLEDDIYEWYILMDYVEDLTKEEEDAINCYMMPMQDNLDYYQEMMDKEEIMNHIEWMYSPDDSFDWNRAKKDNKDPEKIKQLARDFYPKVLNIAKELKRQGIKAADFHSGNVGWDKAHENLVFFDIGGEKSDFVTKYKFKEILTEKFITRFKKFNI